MYSKCILSFAAAVAFGFSCQTVRAQDPVGFQFGYTQGYQNSFRNRLPVPPYFAIYPPVYYGKRFERPYGDSPFAAFPQLRSAPDYYPVPKETPIRGTTVMNPHVEHVPSVKVHGGYANEPVTVAPPRGGRTGRTVEIINPYAAEQVAIQGK